LAKETACRGMSGKLIDFSIFVIGKLTACHGISGKQIVSTIFIIGKSFLNHK